jgi:hypothetical protein
MYLFLLFWGVKICIRPRSYLDFGDFHTTALLFYEEDVAFLKVSL